MQGMDKLIWDSGLSGCFPVEDDSVRLTWRSFRMS